MKRLALVFSVALAGLGVYSSSFAAPQGITLYVGGGFDYLSNAKLDSAQTTVTETEPMTYSPAISFTQQPSWGYTGRGSLGYYFYRDPSKSYSFGLEAGYNYFAPTNSTINSSITTPIINTTFPVTSTEKTNAWATDLEAVYYQELFLKNTSVFFKLGGGYESMTSTVTNVVTDIPNALPNSNIDNTGFGVAGGFGLQYNFTRLLGLRAELDGLKGMNNVGYAQGTLGLAFSFNN